MVTDIDKALGGEFVFNGDKLSFQDSSGHEIPKNLMSFGMTNLGIISTLLKNNVISEGSFLFIDEPETNLHPEWQVLLANVLISLAEKKVNVVIATHSTDMLKALEVNLKHKLSYSDDFLGVHYFEDDGYLMKFESDKPCLQIKEVIEELNSPYEGLYYKGLE